MKTRILKFVKWFLLIWGGISLVATMALGIYIVCWFKADTRDKIDSASPRELRHFLKGCHLDGKQIEQVVHSYISSRGIINAGYVNAFAIKISQVDEADFVPRPDAPNEHWFRGDQLPQVLDAAVKLTTEWHNKFPWFPTDTELRSADVCFFPISVYCCCGRVEPASATLVFVRKSDRMVFYLEDQP